MRWCGGRGEWSRDGRDEVIGQKGLQLTCDSARSSAYERAACYYGGDDIIDFFHSKILANHGRPRLRGRQTVLN